jgi:hypothetical protein
VGWVSSASTALLHQGRAVWHQRKQRASRILRDLGIWIAPITQELRPFKPIKLIFIGTYNITAAHDSKSHQQSERDKGTRGSNPFPSTSSSIAPEPCKFPTSVDTIYPPAACVYIHQVLPPAGSYGYIHGPELLGPVGGADGPEQ